MALAVGSPAWADSTININPGTVPTTAAAFPTHICDPNQGGGPYAGKDVWIFILPGQHDVSGDFVSVTADFGANGTKTITAALEPGNFANGGPAAAKAWIVTDAGWTLVSATAVITGTATFFTLSHTCPASSTPSPSPSTSPSKSPSPSPSVPTTPSSSPPTSGSPTPGGGGSSGATPSGGANTGGGGGQPAGSLAWGLGALAVAAGGAAGLVVAWRRRNNA